MARAVLSAFLISVCAEEYARLIVDFTQHFHTRSVYISTSGIDKYDLMQNFEILRIVKHLSSTAISVGIIHEDAFVKGRHIFRKSHIVPVYVIWALKPFSKQKLELSMNETGWLRATDSFGLGEYALWLLMMNDASVENLFEDIHVPFNIQLYVAHRSSKHETVVDISEVYRVAENFPLEVRRVGSWDSTEDGLSWTNTALYDRRSDLRGTVIKGVTMQNPPYTIVTHNKEHTAVDGSVGRLWNILEQVLNFSTVYTEEKRTSEIRLVFKLRRTSAFQVVVYNMAATRDYGFMRIMSPLITSRIKIYIRRPQYEDPDWSTMLKPLDYKLWISYISVIVLLSITLATFSYCAHRYGNTISDDHVYYSILSSAFYSAGIATLQGQDRTPKLISSRIMYFSIYCVAVVVMAAYSAKIISSLIMEDQIMPFEDIEGLYRDSRYDFITVKDSREEFNTKDIRVKKNDAAFKFALKNLTQEGRFKRVNTTEEGLDRVCNGHFAFMTQEYKVLARSKNVSCDIVPLARHNEVITTALMASAHFPYRSLMHHHIRKLYQSGGLKKLFDDFKSQKVEPEMKELPVVSMKHVRSILLVLVVALFSSVAGVCCEMYRSRTSLS